MLKVDLSRPKVPTQAPKWLGTYGKNIYSKLATYLNKNDKIIRADQFLVEEFCAAYDNYRNSYASIQEDGLQQKIFKTTVSPVDGEIVARDFAGFRKNPAYQMMSDSLSKMNSIGRELGLSPKARSEMLDFKSETNDKKTTKDMMKEFFE
ncbi:phage terminase small subunit P27 family [Lactobacillus sp.]|uniref:phage terminase small subunit P27 family n=1 Tax=Lactobacillus sp. TaxID=1591 RepID=UPI0019AE461C|nr:phage terminase small subunit P27 family [Lactobacillus sp.]MBD5429701.1 phage terminase small subunit P27 family [Lactobacillus sp.]